MQGQTMSLTHLRSACACSHMKCSSWQRYLLTSTLLFMQVVFDGLSQVWLTSTCSRKQHACMASTSAIL